MLRNVYHEILALAKENPVTIAITLLMVISVISALTARAMYVSEKEFKDKMLENCEARCSVWEAKYEDVNQQLFNTLKQVRSNVYKQIDSISNVEANSN